MRFDFSADKKDELVTTDGYRLEPPFILERNQTIERIESGGIVITTIAPSRKREDETKTFVKLLVWDVPASNLVHYKDAVYTLRDAAIPPEKSASYALCEGAVEQSNVCVVDVLVRMRFLFSLPDFSSANTALKIEFIQEALRLFNSPVIMYESNMAVISGYTYELRTKNYRAEPTQPVFRQDFDSFFNSEMMAFRKFRFDFLNAILPYLRLE